jgi:hypothetical protein
MPKNAHSQSYRKMSGLSSPLITQAVLVLTREKLTIYPLSLECKVQSAAPNIAVCVHCQL